MQDYELASLDDECILQIQIQHKYKKKRIQDKRNLHLWMMNVFGQTSGQHLLNLKLNGFVFVQMNDTFVHHHFLEMNDTFVFNHYLTNK